MLFVLWILFLLSQILAQDTWRINLCNRFVPPRDLSSFCEFKEHPFHFDKLDPTVADWSRAVADHVRILSDVSRSDDEHKPIGPSGYEPVIVGCKKNNLSDNYLPYIGVDSYEPFFRGITSGPLGYKLKNLLMITQISPGENTGEVVVIEQPRGHTICLNEAELSHSRGVHSFPPHHYYRISFSKDVKNQLIGDLLEVSKLKKTLPVESKEHNVKIDIAWGIWSCCSTCCCSNEFCGSGYEFSSHRCDLLTSQQTQVGYVSFLKINSSSPVKLQKILAEAHPDFSQDKVEVITKGFDDVLSNRNDPIPIYSHMFFNGLSVVYGVLKKIFDFLPPNINQTSPTNTQPFARFGKVLQTRKCDNDNPQKTTCGENDRCRTLWDQGTKYFPLVTTTVKPNLDDNAWKNSCLLVDFIDLIVGDVYNEFTVKIGYNYRLYLAPNLMKPGDKVIWKVGEKSIPTYDWEKSCSGQDLVVAPDFGSVIIVGFAKGLRNEEISVSLNSIDYSIKFSVKLVNLPSRYQADITLWASLIGGVIIVLLILVALQIYYEAQSKLNLINELEEAAAKQQKKDEAEAPPAPATAPNPSGIPSSAPVSTNATAPGDNKTPV
ncbi:unnamed protein product [Bursaphelenchus xylophilus]|uniref:(pine wood nematode) hypothetical protein n=1 Tax=Bursaphelenchus xylophilus TaxID=6326 RepID=A0A1I7RHM3_BURXY|nr:unnamed protein product [Bursaphelenchus xylophilus]CAG9115596.1 unnamed protein product [Bursaphelenchus xylophilus]